MAETQRAPHVLMIPYPAQGHMLPLLDLAHVLSTRGLSITILVSPANLPLLSPLLSKSPSVQTLSLPFPFHSSIPPGVENTKGQHFSFFGLFIHSLSSLHDPLLSWIRSQSQSHPISAIISDFFLGWTQPLATEIGIPRVVFSPSGVLGTAAVHSLFRRMPKQPDPTDNDFAVSFPSIPNNPSYPWNQLSMLYRTYVEGDPVSESVKKNFLWNLESWGFVSNTFCALEGAYLDSPLEDLGGRRVWAVGPLAPNDGATDRGGLASVSAADVASWLDKYEEGSVVYVSFGSQAVLAPPQAAALAAALERSGVRFIWVVGESTALPEGFEERTAGKGLLIRGWAPQVAILGQVAVGWFVTHCGWNSVQEAAAAGVAMLTWPMTADQFMNARLLTEEAGVAVPACAGGREVVPDPDELARVLAESVGEGGNEVRERAREMGKMAAEAIKEGGSSFNDLDGFVHQMWTLKTD